MSDETQLRVLTFDPQPPSNLVQLPLDNTIPCSGTYICDCAGCQIERQRAAQRGVRPSQPLPIKRKRAA
jgi:hypothetical protein